MKLDRLKSPAFAAIALLLRPVIVALALVVASLAVLTWLAQVAFDAAVSLRVDAMLASTRSHADPSAAAVESYLAGPRDPGPRP